MGASDLQASPLAEGDRRLWAIYIRRQSEVQGARRGGGAGVRLGERGEKRREVRREGSETAALLKSPERAGRSVDWRVVRQGRRAQAHASNTRDDRLA